MKKITSLFLILSLCLSIFPPDIFALSTGITSPENYPGKMDVKNVNGLGKNLSNDFFGGAMTFRYPLSFPAGSRGMTPALELSYASNNTDAFSPYGYGFSLSIPRIQRSAKKGVSELYIGDEFSAFGNDLLSESGSKTRFRSKDANDQNIYTHSGSSWSVITAEGKILVFGTNINARIADPESGQKIYAWMIEEERDIFGHSIRYEYTQNGGQPFLSRVLYGFDTKGNPTYEIDFSYLDKGTSLSSYRTQFEVVTKKLLSKVILKTLGQEVRSYVFSYDDPNLPVSHLMSIGELSPTLELPKMNFTYGEGQFRHMITKVDNNRGGIARFEYAPSTGYRTGSGDLLNTRLPFMVMTLAKQVLEDRVTGISSTEEYEYAGGAYYYDSTDLWGREYVGFARVSVTDESSKKVMYFHQAQTSEKDPLKFDDHIAKKGRVYRTQVFEKGTNILLQEERTRYDMKTLWGERRLVTPVSKISISYKKDGTHQDTAEGYIYDDIGNLIKQTRYGFVNANLTDNTFIDILGDESITERTYTANPEKNILRLPVSQKVYGFSGELLSSTQKEYDGQSSGATFGLVTASIVRGVTDNTIIRDTMSYSPTGMLLSKTDSLGNTTNSSYDSSDIALVSITNPLGWKTSYIYDYTVGKPKSTTNQNNVTTITDMDAWGRELQTTLDVSGKRTLLSKNTYDDTHIPNSVSTITYFDENQNDAKMTKNFLDGWGRTLTSLSTTEKLGQYSLTHVRYDGDGNPIFASYPVFTLSSDWSSDFVIVGSTDGEKYRTKIPGMSYTYDALGRIVSQRTSHGVTKKAYNANEESVTNILGYTTKNTYDAGGNLIQVTENDGQKDIITTYTYDALGRPVRLRDALGNIRTWDYDSLGRLAHASDIHAPTDDSFGIRSYRYDTLGRLLTYENPNHQIVSYAYDTLGRILSENMGTGAIRTYTYDIGTNALGTLSRVEDASTTVSYTYDTLARKIGETRILGQQSYTLGYTYNSANILTSISYPDGGKTAYTYKNGFVEGVDYMTPTGVQNTLISDISYSPNGTMNQIRYGNGAIKTVERDAGEDYRLTRSVVSLSGSTLLDTNYEYDALSDITRIRENGIEPLRKTIDYNYDPLDRLTQANYTYALAGYGRDTTKHLSYTYDALGNIMSASDIGNYTYSGEGYASPHAVTSAGGASYTYDMAGNTESRTLGNDIISFAYSPYGEMLSSKKNGETTIYTYDHTRRRVTKSSPGLIEHHVIDGYEVEYESGAVVKMNNEQVPNNNTGTTNTESNSQGADSSITNTESNNQSSNSGITDTGSTNTGVVNTGATNTGTSYTGTTSTGISLSDSGTTSTGSSTSTGETSTGTMSTGSIDTNTGILDTPTTNTGDTSTGTLSGSGIASVRYIFIAGYESSGGTPATLTTTLTHIMLGDERIATFQTQSDDSPKTLDDDKLVYHISDHLNSSSLDLSSTGIVLQALDYQPFGKSNTYEVSNKRVKGKKGGYVNKYKFANKQEDTETDLQYFEKRYYDNRIGRFTTEDPVFWEVSLTKRPNNYFSSPQNWNSYSYTVNNPINLVDPTGEEAGAISAGATVGTVILVTVSSATLITIGSAVVLAGVVYTVIGLSGNNLTLQNAPEPPTTSGVGSLQSGGTLGSSSAGAISLEDAGILSISVPQSSSAGSPPPGGGGDKGDKGDKGKKGDTSSKMTSKDFDSLAKDKGMKETKEFGRQHGEKVYKGEDGKYYSPDNTSHNGGIWKVFQKIGGQLKRIGTADKDLNIFKK